MFVSQGFDCLEKFCVFLRVAQHVVLMADDTAIDRSLGEWPLLQLMVQTTQPSLAISKDDVSFLQKWKKAITLWQSDQAKRLLQQCNGSTCLVWYSNDTRPLSTMLTSRNSVGDLHWLQRVKETNEFVVLSFFIQTTSTRFAKECLIP